MQENWSEWVHRVTRGMSQTDVAKAAGVNQSLVSRWLNDSNSKPRAEKVVEFARKLGQSPAEALIAASYLDSTEIDGVIEVSTSTSDMSDDELLAELRSRLAERPARVEGHDIASRLTPPDDPRQDAKHG